MGLGGSTAQLIVAPNGPDQTRRNRLPSCKDFGPQEQVHAPISNSIKEGCYLPYEIGATEMARSGSRRAGHAEIRLLILLLILVALASPAIAKMPRGYLDVNYIGVQSHQEQRIDVLTPQRTLEIGLRAVSYPELQSARAAQFNLGVRLVGHFGVGVRLASMPHESTTRFTLDTPALAIVNSTSTFQVLTNQWRR